MLRNRSGAPSTSSSNSSSSSAPAPAAPAPSLYSAVSTTVARQVELAPHRATLALAQARSAPIETAATLCATVLSTFVDGFIGIPGTLLAAGRDASQAATHFANGSNQNGAISAASAVARVGGVVATVTHAPLTGAALAAGRFAASAAKEKEKTE